MLGISAWSPEILTMLYFLFVIAELFRKQKETEVERNAGAIGRIENSCVSASPKPSHVSL